MDKETKKKLLDKAIELKALVYGDFTLSSGLKSNFYFDGRLLSMDPAASKIIAEWIIDKSYEYKADYIGGPAVAAVPLIGASVVLSFLNKKPLSGFFVRSDKKEHGTQKLIEGNIKPKASVVVLDDTISTGGSLFQAISAIQELNCDIKAVLSVLDRKMGGSETIINKGFHYESIFEINSKGELI
jgi:orotate phosphoribosyltransferase